jgi:hypothetical protein
MGAEVEIHAHVSAPLYITPFVARQTVKAFVVTEISPNFGANHPT